LPARHQVSREPGAREIRSWRNSLPALAQALAQAPPAVRAGRIYLEFGLLGASTRADAVIVGLDADDRWVALVIEMKQWDSGSAPRAP
jgi:uncharacterized protein